jgi:class 3 adenylate cyclase
MARRNTLIRFDFRGFGLSDRVLGKSLDDYVLDIEAVVKRVGLEQFALGATQNSTPMAVVYAARHPERVMRFCITDGFLRMRDVFATRQGRALSSAAQIDWVIATEAIGSMVFGAGREELRMWGTYIRACTGPEVFGEEYQKVVQEFDATDFAPMVTAPTLIVSHEGIAFITMEMARDLAARIPNSQLLVIPGTWADDGIATARRIVSFINDDEERPHSVQTPASGMTAILFADIVDSTALTERLGDTAFRAKARELGPALRAVIRETGGSPVEGPTLGDGLLATFASAREAIAAALSCAEAAEGLGLSLHLGLHAGDVTREKDPDGRSNVYGGAVNIASRISGLSAPGEVLVSETVRSLARTSAGVRFEDRGEQTLKGVGEVVRVWAVSEAGQ